MQSIGNEIVVAIQGNKQQSASFQCTLKAVAPTNSNCDCGWFQKGARIVGGSKAEVNEFVSHAGLVDSRTKSVFCGAIICKLLAFLKEMIKFPFFSNAELCINCCTLLRCFSLCFNYSFACW